MAGRTDNRRRASRNWRNNKKTREGGTAARIQKEDTKVRGEITERGGSFQESVALGPDRELDENKRSKN